MLGEKFTFIMLLSGSCSAITLVDSTLPQKGAELELLIMMKRTNSHARPPMPATVWGQVEATDSPHIIGRFTYLFDSSQINIAELISRTQPADSNLPPQLISRSPPTGPASQPPQILSKPFIIYVQN